jgi:hypothetical protein
MAAPVSLSPLEKTNFACIADEKLDRVQIRDPKVFSVFASALQAFIDQPEAPPALGGEYMGISQCIEDLTDTLNLAWIFSHDHEGEFRSIVLEQVAARIRQLNLLASDERAGQAYIERQVVRARPEQGPSGWGISISPDGTRAIMTNPGVELIPHFYDPNNP